MTTITNTPEVRISAAFKVGTVYQQFICGGGHNYYEVTARTAKFVTVKNLSDGTEKRCKVDFDSEKYYCGGFYFTMEVIHPDKKSRAIVANAIATIDAEPTEVDASEYAITAEAQDVAIDAEVENAATAKIERELAKLEKKTATSATAALEILNGLLPKNHSHFVYAGTSNIAGVTYRHFDSIGTLGGSLHKRMIEVVKAGKLDAVIFVDENRNNEGDEIKIVDESETEISSVESEIELANARPIDEYQLWCSDEFKPELLSVLKDIYLDDWTDGSGNIVPAIQMREILGGFPAYEESTTAYRKNSDGTFTEDKDAYNRLREVEMKIPPYNDEPESTFLDELYHELAELNNLREECLRLPNFTIGQLQALTRMIERLEREIAETEFDERTPVNIFCESGAVDSNGNVWL